MVEVTIEVADNNEVDCDYYGYLTVVRRVTLEKSNGDLDWILQVMSTEFNKKLNRIKYINKLNKDLANVESEIKQLKTKISTVQRNVAISRRAVEKLDSNINPKDIIDASIIKNRAKLATLEIKLENKSKELLKINQQYENEKDSIDLAIKGLISSSKGNKITLNMFLSTIIGSTMLYNELCDYGWRIKKPTTLNKLKDNLNQENVLEIPDEFELYQV